MQKIKQVESRRIDHLKEFTNNARTHSPEQIAQLVASIREFGFTNPVLITEDLTIVAGHGRVMAAREIGLSEVPTLVVGADWSPQQLRAYVLTDNQLALNAGWDEELLKAELLELAEAGFDVELAGFDAAALEAILLTGDPGAEAARALRVGSLSERFGVAPFSVLSARDGWWQERKRAWLALGIQSELGRGGNALGFSGTILQPDPAKRTGRKPNAAPAGGGGGGWPT